tara:strand:+ start:374 stop:574 length:201 start_codon:yes stop_codon:yes gene_type:complete
MGMKKKWQVAFDSENIAFGLELFEVEDDAENRAYDLEKKGEVGITLTKMEDGNPVEMWKLENGEWI